MLKVLSACVIGLALTTTALADCISDLREQNDLVDRVNALQSQGGCPGSGAQGAVFIGLLEELLAALQKTENCPDQSHTNSIPKLQERIRNFDTEVKICLENQQAGKAAEELADALHKGAEKMEQEAEINRQMIQLFDEVDKAINQNTVAGFMKAAEKLRELARVQKMSSDPYGINTPPATLEQWAKENEAKAEALKKAQQPEPTKKAPKPPKNDGKQPDTVKKTCSELKTTILRLRQREDIQGLSEEKQQDMFQPYRDQIKQLGCSE